MRVAESRTETPLEARLRWPLRLSRLSLAAERTASAFWPVWTYLGLVIAAVAFGGAALVQGPYFWLLATVLLIGLVALTLVRLRRFRLPTRAEAEARLDLSLPNRPLAALRDRLALGADAPTGEALWSAHLQRMEAEAAAARAQAPDLRLAGKDPLALRLIATTAIVMALLFADWGRAFDPGQTPVGTGSAAASSQASWEAWVEPPLYTGLPSLYLNDITAEAFATPIGSEITFRTYGPADAFELRTDIAPLPEGGAQGNVLRLTMQQAGSLAIDGPGGREWRVSVRPDQAPSITLTESVTPEVPGSLRFEYRASDDYGVRSGTVTYHWNPDAADRRYGLATEPEPRDPLVVDLPLPFRGDRDDFTEVVVEDLSAHPFANLPATVTLQVLDDAGQTGASSFEIDRLPGRRFFDPLANSIIEMRRDLLWSRENSERVAQLLRAITAHPERGLDPGVFMSLRASIQRLEAAIDMISFETQEVVAELLWEAALELEAGSESSALERLRRAQERLSEAMRQGASDAEIAELMRELREAMNDYMQELAQNAEPRDQTDQPDQGDESFDMSMSDLDEMLRRIEELMQEGRMAEAQEMLQALQQMLENMEVTQGDGSGDGPQTPGQEAMEGLQDTLRGQQELSDDSFTELQEQFGQNGSGQPGGAEPGEPGGGEGSLADRQEQLRRQLEEQARRLPGTGTEAGDQALDRLGEADQAMDEAAEALERGDIAEALDLQSQAMEALREGMTELGEALAQEQGAPSSDEMPGGQMAEAGSLQDPLGRQAGTNGASGSEQAFESPERDARRAQELLDLLRDRAAEQTRPERELDYLRRLLDQF